MLVAGRLERLLAERVRTTGTPSTIGDRAAWVEPGGDSPHAFATYLLGGTDNLGYVVVAPRGAGRQKPVVTSLQGEDVSPVPVAALEAGSGVGVRGGERLTRHLLPPTVRAIVLTTEPRSTDAAPGATAWSPEGVRQILGQLRPVHRPMPPCGPPIRGRTLWFQRNTGSWVRVDVTADATGCRAAMSELGGGGRVAGDPVGMARFVDEGEPRSEVSGYSQVVRGAGMSFVLPAGWQVTEGEGFDPCTALLPTVVVAERLEPSCLHGLGQRPSQPYLWITKQPLENADSDRRRGAAARPVATGDRPGREADPVDRGAGRGRRRHAARPAGRAGEGCRANAARRRPVGGGRDLAGAAGRLVVGLTGTAALLVGLFFGWSG